MITARNICHIFGDFLVQRRYTLFPSSTTPSFLFNMSQKRHGFFQGTITPATNFDKDRDAEALHTAMAGLGTDEDTINAILTSRSNAQRQEIIEAFKTKYKTSLVDSLKEELSGDYRKAVRALLAEPAAYTAQCIHDVCQDGGDEAENRLLEITYPQSYTDIVGIAVKYRAQYSADMPAVVTNAANGPFKGVLTKVVSGERQNTHSPDMAQAAKTAAYFVETKPEKWLNDAGMVTLLGTASLNQLDATFRQADALLRAQNSSLEQTVENSTMTPCEKAAFNIIFMSVYQPIMFFVDGLYNSMKGLGTNDDKLIRIIVQRSEIDLVTIKAAFKEKYDKTLAEMVIGDTSGDFKNLLVAIINADVPPSNPKK